jgi:hypothetical protein
VGVGGAADGEVDVALGVEVGPRETGVRVGLGVGEVSLGCAGLHPDRKMAVNKTPMTSIHDTGIEIERVCNRKCRTRDAHLLEALNNPFFMSHSLDRTIPGG